VPGSHLPIIFIEVGDLIVAKQAQIDAVRPVLNALDAEVTAAEKVLDAVEAGADKATDVLESGLEKVADVVPEALDKSVNVTAEVTRKGVRALRDPRKVVIILGISFAVVGAGVGYLTYKGLKRRLEKEFDARVDHEVESMRDFYQRKYRDGKFATPQSTADALGAQSQIEAQEAADAIEALEDYQKGRPQQPTRPEPVAYDKVQVVEEEVLKGVTITADGVGTELAGVKVEEKDIPVDRNVLVNDRPIVDDNWDAEAEEANRDPAIPYVISYEEFMENAYEHSQTTLTYYEGDDVLCEADGSVVFDIEKIIGDNLGRFGHGSKEQNIVYIRNEVAEADYEVVKNTGNYADIVHGLRHSAHPNRRFRVGDDG
jgi:hypothetical protein